MNTSQGKPRCRLTCKRLVRAGCAAHFEGRSGWVKRALIKSDPSGDDRHYQQPEHTSADAAYNPGHGTPCFPLAANSGHDLANGIEFLCQHRYAASFIRLSMSQIGALKQWSGLSMFNPKRMLCFRL
jgi:hypothetical protein